MSKNPSSLVEVPRVNEKYEIKSFFGGPGARPTQLKDGTLRTLGMLDYASSSNPLDSILNLNPTFYGGGGGSKNQGIKEASDNLVTDPYAIFNK